MSVNNATPTYTPTASALGVFTPDWPAPAKVKALQTTRNGFAANHGFSLPPFSRFNLGSHVSDLPEHVAANRALLAQALPQAPAWLNQVHGIAVVDAANVTSPVDADASYTRSRGVVSVVMTADCLPLLFCDRAGTVVASAHAGWRGLCNGVIEATISKMTCPADEILVWLGPAIGPNEFEVGDEVRAAFNAHDAAASLAFKAKAEGKWLADIYLLARQRLHTLGITAIYGGDQCTVTQAETYFSYRRDGQTGRLASLIWLE
ncbi:peptidoglycan editing factor PgeF [Chitinibacter fontanus]|uniref:Purine nucleoside phosphorylase n=1 Tax=Chitinibacter fontanus TaxID=1737446 RepID=A0A7D5ZAY2_9NEIS|nr:peptidoglycan editing factor PgeF [Chitinibacter fontanus]QLI80706.1 peptidoglycan editing factor PgeF [Chitinibacter fontanus]